MLRRSVRILWPIGICATVMPLLVACQQPSAPAGTTTVFSLLASAIHSDGDKLKDLIKAGKFKEAADWYGAHREFFDSRPNDYSSELADIAEHLNAIYEPRFEEAIENLDSLSWPPAETEWKKAAAALAQAKALHDEYDGLYIFLAEKRRSEWASKLLKSFNDAERLTEVATFTAFQKHGLFNPRNFFADYPVRVQSVEFLTAHKDAILAMAQGHQFTDFRQLASTYQHMQAPIDLLIGLSNLAFQAAEDELSRSGMASNQILFAALKNTRDLGYKPKPSSVRLIKILPRVKGDFSVTYIGDPGIDVDEVKEDQLGNFLKANGVKTAILVVARDAHVSRSAPQSEDVNSSYRAGYRSEPNPDYAAAVLQVQKAQQDVGMAQLNYTANQNNGFGALAAAIGEIGAQSAYDKALQQLKNTAPTVQIPVSANYSFKKVTVSSEKSAAIAASFVDVRNSAFVQINLPVTDHREFSVLYNLRDDDENRYRNLSGTSTESEVTKWEAGDIPFQLPRVIDAMQSAMDQRKYSTIEQVLSGSTPRQVAAAVHAMPAVQGSGTRSGISTDPRMRSVVVVKNPTGVQGAGFYVSDDLVITNEHVIEGTQFVEMTLFDGRETFGKVVAQDALLDVALIRAQMRGPAVKFYSKGDIQSGATVDALGHPRGLTFSITRGVISAIRELTPPGMPGGKPVVYVQTDASINPGNSGGPMFVGNEVVGMSTFQLKQAEGLGFAIHYSELQGFIRRNAGK